MLYRATHTTRYRYDATVSQCQSEVRLTPRALPWQALLESTHRDHARSRRRSRRTRTTSATTSPRSRFSRATTASRSWPRAWWTCGRAPRRRRATCRGRRCATSSRAHERPETLEAFEFVFDSPFVAAGAELAAYARAQLSRRPRRCSTAVDDLSHRIHAEFTYEPNATTIDTPLLDALKARRGVCQDFSHVMIGALRSLRPGRALRQRLPAQRRRLPGRRGVARVGVGVRARQRLGGLRSDQRRAARHRTRDAGWGRDYGDVTPVKGIALGGGQQAVDVEVRVEPIDAARA